MDSKFKRLLSFVLALVMVIGMVPVSQAQAVEGETEYVSVKLTGLSATASSTVDEGGVTQEARFEMLFDGHTNSGNYWATKAVKASDCWLRVDLGGLYTINRIDYTMRFDDGQKYACTGNLADYIIEVCTDEDITDDSVWKEVTRGNTVGEGNFNKNYLMNTLKDGTFEITFEETLARHVRLKATKSYIWDGSAASGMAVGELAIYKAVPVVEIPFEVIPRYNSNRLTWTVESGVTCNVECSTDGGATFTTVATAEADGEYIHENVGVGTQYQYRLAMSNDSYSQTVRGAVTGMEALKATAVKYVDYGAEGKVFTHGLNPDGEMEIFAEGNDVDKLNALNSGTIIYKANYTSFNDGDTLVAVLGMDKSQYVGTSANGGKYRHVLGGDLAGTETNITPVRYKDFGYAVVYEQTTGKKNWISAADGAEGLNNNIGNGYGLLSKSGAGAYYVGCTVENGAQWKKFNGTIFYVMVTPEILSLNELKAITATNNVAGVTLNETAMKLDVEKTGKLTANVTAEAEGDFNQKVFWTSNNENVATVDSNGNVTAVGAGDATITVTTVDMHLTATCAVHVHSWGEGVLDPKPDFENNGTMTYTCSVCGGTKTESVSALKAVAKIGEQGYESFAEALAAASAMTGDVTVEIYDRVILNQPLTGSYSSIKFVGKNTDAEIYLDVQGYTTATGKKVAFEALTLSKSAGGHIANAGFMNVAFGIYDVIEVTYTNCTFANGAYASSGKVVFAGCTFKRSHDKYGLWAYGDVDVTVDGCTFADDRGIKMYDEGRAGVADLTVKNTDFSAVTGKPAIVLTYGESVTLERNTYSGTGTFELDLDGAPNGTAVTSDVAPICKNDNGACGVLVDGKIYTTVAQAAAAAVENSKVTVLYSTEETAEFPKGTDLSLAENVEAPNVTVKQPIYVAQVGEAKYESVIEALQAAASIESNETVVVELLSDVREVMPTDIELRLKSNVKIVSGNAAARAVAAPVVAEFYNNGTAYDFVFDCASGYTGKTLTIGENVTFELKDRVIWAGYYGTDVKVVVDGTLAGYQYWNGADTTVNSTGTLKTTGEALVLRRGADLTVNGGELNANYFNMLSGNLIATNGATVNCGPVWIDNTAGYAGEGNVTITVVDSTLNSNGNLKSSTTHADGVKIDIRNSDVQFNESTHAGCVLDANSTIIIGAGSDLELKTLTGAGTIEIDVTGMDAGEIESISGNLSGFTGNISVTNVPEGLEVKRDENGNVVLVAKPVAKVGDTVYTSIDEAIANWTNGTTLTLLADVTLSDVITLKSTEHHILNLGTYTMTAASGKNAIVIQACGNGSAERNAITINADATNPGGINAGSKSVIYYKYADGGISTEDRPIIKINGGVFTGSTSSFGTAGIYTIGTAARKCATLNITGGTFNCSINGSGKSKLLVSGGTFNYSVGSQGDSTALRLISGGTFKTFGFMTADSNNTKFWFGTSMGNSNVGVHVDDNGYIVVGGAVITEPGETFAASSANYGGANSLLQYSSAKNNGLYYTSVKEALADNNTTSGSVTVYVDELDMSGISYKGTIVVPADETLTVKNAPANLKVTDSKGNALTPDENGTYIPPKGSVTIAFTSETGFWGEGGGNAKESLVVSIYEGDKVIGTASLNNIGGILNGNVYVSWQMPFAGSRDAYWNVVWAEGYPNVNMAPTKVTMTIDGVEIAENVHQWNAPDNLNPIVALAEKDGKVGAYLSVSAAVAAGAKTITLVRDTNEQIVLPQGVTLNTNGHKAEGILAPVAMIGTQGYATLQAALNAAAGMTGEVTVTLVSYVTEDVTLTEKTGLYYTIDGNGNKMNGTITISSLSDTNDNRRITIKGINFVTETARDFITSTATNHYPRLTVEGCSFTGTGAEKADTVAVRLKSSHSVIIKDCTGTGLHSFLQNTAGWNLTVENVTVTNSKSGLALGTVQGVVVERCNIDVNGYGIRMDAKYNNNAVISDNTVTAFIPVVVREASVDSNITVSGSNTMTAENTDSVWFAIGTTEYKENGKLPTASTGKVIVKLDDAGLDRKGIFGQYAEAKIGDLKYTTLAEAVAAAQAGDEIVLLDDVTIAEGETIEVDGFKLNAGNFKLTNNGTVNVCGNVTFVAPEMTGNAINGHNATLADSNIGVGYNVFGTENKITGNTTIKGITSVGYGYTTTEKVALNITGNFNGTNVLVSTGSGYDHELTVGDASGERTTVYFGQLGTFGDAHITNTDVTYGYAFIRNDLTLTNSSMTINGGVNTYISGNAKVVLDNSTWNMPGYANIGSYGGYSYGNADVTLKNGSAITATNLGIEVNGDKIVKVTLEDNSNLTATKLTNAGTIVLSGVDATITANECGNVISGLTDYKIGYVDGGYKLIAKVYVAEIVGGQKFESLAEAYAAAQDGDTIKLISGENVISMAGSVVGGKTVTITGTAIVDWTKGNLMIGRDGEGDGKVIFDGANITSSVKMTVGSTGIHVSGSKGSDNTTNNGVLVIKNSNIELDYLINRNETIVEGNSNLTVYGGCWTHGRDASESVSGTDETATLTIESGSTVTVVNENGMGVGGEGLGIMNVKGTYHANVLNVRAKGTVNVEGGNLTIDGTATNNGTINVNEGVSTLNIATLTGSSIDLNEGAIVKDSTVGGAAYVAGNVTFRGDNIFTMITDYGDYYSSTTPSMWTVEKGASLTLTKYDRYGLGYGDQVTIYGELTDALTARENLTDADADVNMYGGLVGMTNSAAPDAQNKLTIEDAYVIFGVKGDKSFGNKAGNYYGNYEFVIDNSVITANGFKFYEDKGNSVLTMNKTDLLVNGVFMTNDASSKFTFTDSVIVSKATSNGSDDKNQNAGELILVNSSLTYNAPFTNIGTLTLGAGSSLTAPSIIGTGTITIDASNLAAGAIPVVGNATGFTGTVVVTGNDALEAELTEQGIKLVGKPIALVDDNNNIISYHSSLTEAAYAVAEGGTIKLLKDVVINENTRTENSGWFDGLYYVGDKSFTIDLGGFTVTHDGSVNDYLLNFKNDGSKANVITLKNGTVDAGTKAFCALCTSSTSTQQITINLENINLINNISNGSVAKIRGGAVLNVNAGTVITGKDSYLGIECVASTVNIYDGAEIYMNGTSSYNGCLVGACGNGTVNVYGGYGKGVKGGFIAMTSGGTINVYGGEWIANTDGTVGNNSNLYVLTAQNNSYESGYAGASIINVTGGTFRGGMDAWILNTGRNEVAELNISGGNFNADPTAYIEEDHKVIENADGTFDVKQMVHLIINVGGSGISTMALRQDERDAATMDEAVEIAKNADADQVTYKISGEVKLTTGGTHGILDLGKNVTIEGATPDAKLTIVGGGVPDIKGVTFKNITLADQGTYNSHVNEFMYQNYIDCSFENVTFVDGIRLSGKSTLTDCTVEANTANEYAIWLDKGEFTMTDSKVIGGNDAYGLIKSDEVDKITITGNTFQYLGDANKEALNVKGAVIDAEGNTFIDCAKGILPADKTNYAADGSTVLTESAVAGENRVIINVAEINGQKFETLDAAYAAAQNGDEVVILKAGSYKLPTGKNITITGKVDGIVFTNIGAHNMGGASVTFNNVTFNYYPNVNYTGLQHSGNLEYNNCTINGQVFLYGQSETFNNCTFNQNSADAYNVWTYGAKEVDFNNCTFNSAGKAVLVYTEEANHFIDLDVTGSTFNASAPVDGKAAIEIDTSLTAGANITIDAATTATGFGKGNVSGNSLWNNKKGNNTDANNDVTVKVGDKTVLAPVIFVAKIGDVGYTTLVDAFKAATEGCTIEILEDVTIDYKWDCRDYVADGSHSQFKESVTINGNGNTIKFTGAVNDGNWNTIFRFEENAKVNNLTIDISEATGALRVIAAKKSLSVDGLTIIGSAKYGIIFGEGASAADLAAAEIEVKNSTLTGTRRAISDNEGGKDVKSVTVTGNTLNANVYVSASENVVFSGNTANGEVDIRSYSANNILKVEAKDNTLAEGKKNYIFAKKIDAQDEFTTKYAVSTKAELNAALAAAQEGDTIVLTADIDYGTDQLAITKAITLDLGGKTLTTRNAYGGMSIKNNPTIKNGTIVHASNTAAIKVWNATAFEDLVIDVQGKGDANKTIGGIVLQSGSTTRVGSIKNVTIKGAALTNGIETYNCGDATENVIGSMEKVTIDALGTGLKISAPCGTATNCSISGGVNGIELWIKGNYSASLTLENSEVKGGVYAHDEFSSNPDIVNSGFLTLTVDDDTTGASAEDVTLTLNRIEEEQVEGEVLKTVIENAQAKVNGTYYATINEAMAAAKAGDTVTILAGEYTTTLNVNKAITVAGEGNVIIKGKLNITADGATVKNLTVKNSGTACYINAKGVLVEGCNLSGSNGLYQSYTSGTVTFKDSTITGSTYGVHFDGSAGGNIVIDNCKVQGWTSFAASIEKVTISDTEFAEGNYNKLRFYQDAELTNVKFNPKMTVDFGKNNVEAIFNNCSVTDGSALTEVIYLPDIAQMGVEVKIDNEPVVVEAMIGNTAYLKLADAFAAAEDGDEVKIYAAGTYKVPTGKNITITGMVGGVVFDNIGKHNMGGANVTFNNVTFDYYPNVNYTGLQHSGNLEYNNCTINGQVFLYGQSETFNNCTFNQNSADAYNVWTYSAKDVAFNDCTFNSVGKSVLVYAESAGITNDISVTNSTFNASAPVDGKAAIEIDTSLTAGANITIDAATTATGFGNGNVSGNSLWNNKKGNNTDANNDVTVKVAGVTVLAPVTFVAKIGEIGYTTLQAAINAAENGDNTIVLLEDNDENVTIKQVEGVNIVIDGNGKVYSGTITIHGNARSNGAETLTIQNFKFETSEAEHYFIDSNSTGSVERYAHNVTVRDSSFSATGAAEHTAAAMRIRQGFNISMQNVVADGMHSMLQAYGNAGVTISGLNATNMKNGISAGTSTDVVIDNVKIEASGYGIRADGTGAYDLTVKNSTVDAELPVVIRKNTASGYALTMEGNTLTGSNGYGVVFTAGDDGTYVAPEVGVKLNVSGTENVFPAYTAKIGDLSYATLADAVAAANAGDKIVMLAPAVVAAGETLELNKAVTITYTSNVPGEDMITNRGNLVIDGATLVYTNTDTTASNVTVSTISCEPGSNLEVKSGTVKNESANNASLNIYAFAIDLLTNGGLGDVTATISGGKIISTYMAIRQFNNGDACKNTLNVTGGEIYGEKRAIQIHQKNDAAYTTISGGEIKAGEGGYALCFFPTNATNIAVTGGTFTGTVYSGSNGFISGGSFGERFDDAYCAEGYVTVKNSDGTFGVKVGEYTVKNTDTGFGYVTLADALAAVQNGDNTIVLLKDNSENVTIEQVEGVNIVIDGQNHLYTGTITIDGNSRFNGAETLTIQNVEFVTSKADHYFIDANSSASADRYAHNVTVKDSTFTATGAGRNSAVAMRIRQGFDISIKNVTASNMHSLFQGYGCDGLTVDDVTVSGKNGIAVGTSKNVEIKNADIIATGYGIRADGTAAFDMTVENATIKAKLPIVVRKNNADGYQLTMEGTNNLSGNANGYQVIFTAVDDEEAPVAPTVNTVLDGIDNLNVYPAYQAKIGNVYYPTLAAAIAAAEATDVVTVLGDIELAEPVTVASGKTVTIDLNGKTISGTDNTEKNFGLFQNNGTLTINDSVGTGKIVVNATINSGWNRYSAVISNNPGGTLVVNGGTIEHLGGTDMAYGIDSLTNGGIGDVSVTINGGHIKSTYRGIRQFLNSDSKQNELIVNDGTIEGANKSIFFHDPSTKANNGKLIVAEAAELKGDVYLFVTEGSTEWPVEVAIAKAAVTGEVTYKNVPTGYEVLEKNGIIRVEYGVAMIGDVYYATLAEAIAAAKNGDTIKLLIDVTENVTVNKNVTIDGNGKNYTGKMTLNKVDVTIENVNFVKGTIYKNKNTGTGGNYTIKKCTFDGEGMSDYAINLGGTYHIVIEDCTAKNYGYGLLQVPSANTSITVKNVEISNVSYGLKIDYSNGVTLENVTIKDANIGIYDSNFGAKTYTIKNSTIEATTPIEIWDRNTGKVDTFVFEGNNSFGTNGKMEDLKGLGNLKLADVNATLTAPAGLTVTTNLGEDYKVVYENGMYKVVSKVYVAEVNGVKYEKLSEAIAAASAGAKVTLLADVAENVTVNKNLTIDGADKTLTGKISITGAVTTTIQNLNVVGGIAKDRAASNITIIGCDFDGQGYNDYALNLRTNGRNIVIENCTAKNYTSYGFLQIPNNNNALTVKNVSLDNVIAGFRIAASNTVTMEKVTITNATYGIWDNGAGSRKYTLTNCDISATNPIHVSDSATTVQTFNFVGANTLPNLAENAHAKLVLNADATLTAPAGLTVTTNVGEDYKVVYENGMYKVVAKHYVAQIGTVKYESLSAAIAAAQAGDTITLIDDVEENVTVNKNLTIDGADKTLTGKITITGAFTTTIQDLNVVGGIAKERAASNITIIGCDFDGQGYNGYALDLRTNGRNIVIENCTAKNYTSYGFLQIPNNNNALTVKNVSLDNVIAGFRIAASNTVTMENVTITNATYGIWDNGAGSRKYTLTNCDISATNPIHVSDSATTVQTFKFEGINDLHTENLNLGQHAKFANGAMVGTKVYETLTAAIAAGDTVKLLADNAENVEIAKSIVLNVNGKNYTGTVTLAADVTLTAVEGLNVITNVPGYNVSCENGIYKLVEKDYVAEVNGVGYESIQEAVEAATDGDTITVTADHELIWDGVTLTDNTYPTMVMVAGKTVTIDLNGKVLTVDSNKMAAHNIWTVISADEGGAVTLTGNGTIYADGETKPYSLMMAYEPGTKLTVENGTYYLKAAKDCLIYSGGDACVTINGGNFTLGNVGDGSNGQPWIFNVLGQNEGHVTVNGGTFNADVNHQFWAHEVDVPETLAVKPNGDGTWTVVDAAAYAVEMNHDYTRKVGYATLAEAIAASETVGLVTDVAENVELSKSITLELNGKTMSGEIVLTDVNVTLTAAEGLNVTTNIEHHKVDYVDGVYKVVGKVYVAQIGDTKYESIQEAVEAVEAGATATITVIDDHELVWDGETKIDGQYAAMAVDAGKTIILDLNGKKLTANTDEMGGTMLFAVFAADEGGNLTVTGNGTVEVTGAAAAYCLMMAYEPGTKLTIENGTYYLKNASDSLIFSGGDECVIINGGSFTLGNVGDGTNGKPWIFNVLGGNDGAVIVNGGTFNADVNHQFWANEVYVPETLAVKPNGDGTWTVVNAAAYIMETATSTGSRERKVGYATLAEAIAAVKTGETVTLLADNAEDIELTKSITLDLNRMYMTGEITLASADAQLTSAKDLNVVTTIADAEVVYENGTYMVKKFVYVAQIGETKYDDLSDALEIAGESGETVKVIANTSEELVLVPAGVKLDLNGYVVTAGNVLSFGVVMDTASEVGGIAISNDTTQAFVKLQKENGNEQDGNYLPIYDTEDERGGMYKFFKFELVNLGTKVSADGNDIKFGFKLKFANLQAYEVLATTADSCVDLNCIIAWSGMKEQNAYLWKFSDAAIVKNAKDWLSKPTGNWALTLTISGLSNLEAGKMVWVTPTLSSDTDVNFENVKIEYVKSAN